MRKIAIIEDDTAIRELVKATVESAGFFAAAFCCAEDFLKADYADYSLLLLDIMLPGMDGFALFEKLSSKGAVLPVIFLTAKAAELDKVKGLNMGACDYISKPFGVLELIARINAVLRRTEAPVPRVLYIGPLEVDAAGRSVKAGGSVVELTHKEYELLLVLAENEGVVLTRERLLETVWDITAPIESRTLDMHIRTLRQKLGEAGALIKTVRGVGYVLRAEDA